MEAKLYNAGLGGRYFKWVGRNIYDTCVHILNNIQKALKHNVNTMLMLTRGLKKHVLHII